MILLPGENRSMIPKLSITINNIQVMVTFGLFNWNAEVDGTLTSFLGLNSLPVELGLLFIKRQIDHK